MGFFSRLKSAVTSSAKAPFRATARVGRATFGLGKTIALQPIRGAVGTARFIRHPTKRGFFNLLTEPVRSTGGAAFGVAKASAAVPFAPATAFGRGLFGKKAPPPPRRGRFRRRRRRIFRGQPPPKPGIFDFLTKPTLTPGSTAAPPAAGAPSAAPGAAAPASAPSAGSPTGTSHAAYDIPGGADDDSDAGVPSSGGTDVDKEQGDDTSSRTDLERALDNATGGSMSTEDQPIDRYTSMTQESAGDEQPFEYGGERAPGDAGESAEEAYSTRLDTVDKGDGVEIPVHMYENHRDEEGDDTSTAEMYTESLGYSLGDSFTSELESGLKSFGRDVAKEGASRILTGTAKKLESESKSKPKVEYEVEAKPMSTGKKLVIGAAIAVPAIILAARFLRPKAKTNPRRRRRRR